ncbi:hypothetical protein OIU85_018909 [Salix viminalis]|uniref:Uncharacterized protein n=1 Tax=Salix viminalis TaxID=40686 RepID=A0A9Q0UVA5_SALVM|nr:hypothetical protein OIU85_018909 [Salix viminalis]
MTGPVLDYDFDEIPDFDFDEIIFQDGCSIDSLLDEISCDPAVMEVPRADEIPFQDFAMMDEVGLWR